MAIKKVLQYGTKSLRDPSKEVHKVSKKVKELIKDLLDTMYSQNGVGLAAPQIGENYRVFVVDTSKNDEPLNPIVFINPKIIKKTGAVISHEGCLSFPEAYTDIRRYKDIMIKALDENGRAFVMEAKGGELLSRAIQHEFDHLDGILFIDHVIDLAEAQAEMARHNLPQVEVDKLLADDELVELIKLNPNQEVKK